MGKLTKKKRSKGGKDAALPAGDVESAAPRPRRNYARWRALTLSLVYVVFAIHIVHWKITGKSLAPLELNEVMYTLELGIITAGFLFMCFLVLGTAVFGRFFCSWACHIMVLQDLCAWVLRKLGIRRKPIRSRLLLLVPPFTAFYMFVWPQFVRMYRSHAFPEFHFRTDSQGWASFVTDNFWRNLPNAPVIILTFLVCGFAIVYLLGSRTFCTYICPYGAIFALADRLSPGRIRVSDACKQCGTCTAVCTSGIRVHEEVKQHGIIVNPACMKDLDCVSACPQQALSYGIARPAFFASRKSGGRFGLPYDFTWKEELVAASVFLVVLLSFRGLYSRVPFLLSLALGAIFAYGTIMTLRLATHANVTAATLRLKALGRMTAVGWAYMFAVLPLTALVGHSAFVRFHEFTGLQQARQLQHEVDPEARTVLATSVLSHLATADRWGLIRNIRVERGLLSASLELQRLEEMDRYATRLLKRDPYDATVRMKLGRAYFDASQRDDDASRLDDARQQFTTIISQWETTERPPPELGLAHQALGELHARHRRFPQAVAEFQRAVALRPDHASAHAGLGSVLAELGRIDEGIASLEEAVRLEPNLGRAQFNLGTLLAHRGDFASAIPHYELAVEQEPDDAELHNNFGFALMRVGRLDESQTHLERAVALDAASADAHFNLGALFASQNQPQQAAAHFRQAVDLDPRYRRFLEGGPPG